MSADNTNMAIYFDDREYLESFMNYISERNTGFNCLGFTKGESLKSYAGDNEIALLLTDTVCFERDARHINSGLTVVLTERPDEITAPDIFTVNILQPVDGIVQEILKAAARMEISVATGAAGEAGNIFTFFSPVGRSLKTTLAMAASQLLSDKERTIYLNLEPDSGFTVLFRQDHDTDLSDLIFYLRDGAGGRARLMLESAVCESQGVSFIPPVMDPQDLMQLTGDEITDLINLIRASGYKNIVLDTGILLKGFEKLLYMSSRIYMPVREDAMSKAKTAQFYSYLRTLEPDTANARLLDDNGRIKSFTPPFFKDLPKITENLRPTDVGSYARELLTS